MKEELGLTLTRLTSAKVLEETVEVEFLRTVVPHITSGTGHPRHNPWRHHQSQNETGPGRECIQSSNIIVFPFSLNHDYANVNLHGGVRPEAAGEQERRAGQAQRDQIRTTLRDFVTVKMRKEGSGPEVSHVRQGSGARNGHEGSAGRGVMCLKLWRVR